MFYIILIIELIGGDKMSIYMCIDLKSFYASVECRERGLDPLNTNLVVADANRTEKTICLAVTPSLKSYGIPGRARLYEVIQKVGEVNLERKKKNYNRKFSGKSYFDSELKNNYSLELDFIKATPRMKLYMKYSSDIYKIYLKYIAPEDMKEAIAYLNLKEVNSGANVVILSLENDTYIKDSRVVGADMVVSPLQIYLDCMQIKGRGEEMAEAVLRKEILK